MNFDIKTVPFSYCGSYLAFSYPRDGHKEFENHLAMRILYGTFDEQETYPIVMLDDKNEPLVGSIDASPTELKLKHENRFLKICYQNENTVHIIANSAVMITKTKIFGLNCDRIMQHEYGAWEIAGNDASLFVELYRGSIENKSIWSDEGTGCENIKMIITPDTSGEFEIKITLSDINYNIPEKISYEQNLSNVQKSYQKFCMDFKADNSKYADAMELAAYISWHSIVKSEGYVKYPVMLMTKNKMNMVWSWDYTFNALAMIDKHTEIAYEQFLAMAEMQDSQGAYPDAFHANRQVRVFVKPPVQGFILDKMYKIQKPNRDTMIRLYDSVSKFTNWWFDYRGRVDGIPEYNHGNDSGWDNSTVFKLGVPVKSPDLCTWLILQMDFLSETAKDLGMAEQSKQWHIRSEQLLQKMLEFFVVDNRFCAVKIPDNTIIKCDSLLLYIPLLLADRLPENIRKKMLDELLTSKKFITEYGIASEPIDSQYFIEDGYWRGAIWPPTTYIMTELLVRNGRQKEAVQNAQKFCDMCAKSGFFENYSAINGRGLRDSGFTWTASVFMILLRDYI